VIFCLYELNIIKLFNEMVTDCKGQKQNISGNSLQMLFNL
jgi:hypothetical protein